VTNRGITKIVGWKHLSNVKEIHLASNKISDANGTGRLKETERLKLDFNELEQMGGLKGARSLRHLSATFNKIEKIDGLSKSTKLEEINLRGNKIIKIDGLNGLYDLKRLNLEKNEIVEMEGLDDLFSLTSLKLSHNRIKIITGIASLGNLKLLDLSHNKIDYWNGDGMNEMMISTLNRLRHLRGLNWRTPECMYTTFKQISLLREGCHRSLSLSKQQELNKRMLVFERSRTSLRGGDDLKDVEGWMDDAKRIFESWYPILAVIGSLVGITISLYPFLGGWMILIDILVFVAFVIGLIVYRKKKSKQKTSSSDSL